MTAVWKRPHRDPWHSNRSICLNLWKRPSVSYPGSIIIPLKMLSPARHITAASFRPFLDITSRQFPRAAASSVASRGLSATASLEKGVTLLQDKEDGFGFARSNPRPAKPRSKGVTEIRGPYYTVRWTEIFMPLRTPCCWGLWWTLIRSWYKVMGKRYLADVLET